MKRCQTFCVIIVNSKWAFNFHVGRIHKADGYSPILQLDGEAGQSEENNGKEAFKCLECKLLFIPMCHMLGNKTFDYESCRRNLRVIKFKNCASTVGGRGDGKTRKFDFQLAPYLFPFSWPSWFQKHKTHHWEPPGSASSGCHFCRKIYKGNYEKYKNWNILFSNFSFVFFRTSFVYFT